MASVLIVEDNELFSKALAGFVKRRGHQVSFAYTCENGVATAHEECVDVVFLDVRLPDRIGTHAVAQFRQVASDPEVIVMTGLADVESAEVSMRQGAWAYIVKGTSFDPFLGALDAALNHREEKLRSPQSSVDRIHREGLVGSSPQFCGILSAVARVAPTNANVLVTGETGTGKERLARAIHVNSARAEGNFVIVDCAALPGSLVESILFGHVRGAFTGADRERQGLIQQANGGTLFLDEIGELPSVIQPALLRVLQERRFRPIGATGEVRSDFRLIAATNRDLDEMAQHGQFREDLLFRLRGFTINIPPLRERTVDIQDITNHHIGKICRRAGIALKRLSPEFFDTLARYPWPGNVRELVQALESAVANAHRHDTLFPLHLPDHIRVHVARMSTQCQSFHGLLTPDAVPPEALPTLNTVREAAIRNSESAYLKELLAHTQGRIDEACRISGLSRSRLYALLKEHGITVRP
ncbi:MAG: sigma-54 dependent transcriptional regulator [Candidatus Hydrogenedentes bacterium]|nr:sigma-54 dependent transcriptional regulator [Candidatus Hydrogenedentota bacterium]